ncbi:MAG TPA: FG-GAP-like repeat-containing protein, partial [Myxococcota bacterium]
TCDETGACCPNENLCGTVCCDAGTVCAFLECLTPGEACFDDAECAGGEYCDFSLGEPPSGAGGGGGGDLCSGGTTAPEGKCMPRPPICPDGTEPGDPPSCVTSCEYHPEIGVFSPEMKYAWGDPADPTNNVMMAPIVIQLDDDDCDGAITERDIPEIVFFTFDNGDYNNGSQTASTLRAISIVDGVVVEKLEIGTDGVSADAPGRSIAGGDIDGDGQNEIVVCTVDNRTRAYRADGTEMWLSEPSSCYMPSLADLDQDGTVEIVDRGSILDGATGVREGTFPTAIPVVSDVDGDGLLDIVTPNAVYDATGAAKVTTTLVGTHAAVGDLDLDGSAEIVAIDTQTHTVHVWRVTGPGTYEIVREGLDINEGIDPNPCCVINPNNAGCTRGGGAPTIARFNEDEYPDVALAGGIGYVVFDGQALMDMSPVEEVRLWLRQTQDCSSAQTGSSVFDFDGDGVAEVVYADERTLHIYAGPTGEPLFETCSTNGTLVEYPLVADVDNDGHADIVVGSNSYSGFTCDDG